ncbi:hypothetical protein N657DRAFT_680093 [Parathielavia appendiculata]|uniref:Uncharacterized protein n=1 Tax=Parathielavia appendiculata TaxID=2587402 RepID=A0AAN6U5B2_9PEZI|nr:hypothetical protein N657DRAFT_680093 [Parathielavia appendiculata]
MAPKFAALLAENVELCKKRKAIKFLGNTQLVSEQRIDIPQSLLIEEAAETREQNTVSALYPSIQ